MFKIWMRIRIYSIIIYIIMKILLIYQSIGLNSMESRMTKILRKSKKVKNIHVG